MRIAAIVRTAVVLTVLTASALSGVIVVTPGGVGNEIQLAVDAAAPGDLILVQTGSYDGFVLDGKALTITGDLNSSVFVSTPTVVRNTTAGQQVALGNLNFRGGDQGIALELSQCAGPVMVDACTAIGSGIPLFFSNDGVFVSNCDAVTFVDLVAAVSATTGIGLSVQASDVDVWDATISGGVGFDDQPGPPGVQVTSGTVFLSDTTLIGGRGGPGTLQSPFQICTDGAVGGPALSLAFSDPLVRLRNCTLSGGLGGEPGGPGCVAGPQGPEQDITSGSVVQLPGGNRFYAIPSPAREGDAAFISWVGEPGDFVWIFYGLFHDPTFVNAAKGPLAVGGPSTTVFIGGPIGPSGVLTIPLVTPIGPGPDSFVLYEQGLFWNPTDKLIFANPRLGVVLDESL